MNYLTDCPEKSVYLKKTSESLFENGDIDKALEVANSISYEIFKNYALILICNHLVENDKEKAIEIFKSIPEDFTKINENCIKFKEKTKDKYNIEL